jgi:hypothetical protein
MTAATIVVELPPGDVASPYVYALLDSCSVGTQGKARCVLGPDADGSRSIAVAMVGWASEARVDARIEVGVHMTAAPRWETRELSFSAADPEVERWRATGFAIATVVGDIIAKQDEQTRTTPEVPAATRETASARPLEDSSVPQVDLAPTSWWLDGQVVASAGVQGAAPAAGGALRLSRRLGDGSWLLAASARCTGQAPNGVQIVRPDGSVGLGLVPLRLVGQLRLGLRLEPLLELIEATARDAAGRSGDSSRWRFGLREAVDMSWMWSGRLGVVATAEVSELSGATEILAHGQSVAVVPAIDITGGLGLRVALP